MRYLEVSMTRVRQFSLSKWVWRSVAALTLVLGLAVAPVLAAPPTGANLLVFAPGANMGAPVTVQWLDPLTGVWHNVDGWTGTLDSATATGVPFKAWGVLPANYGQGVFRWVIFNPATTGTLANGMAAGNSSAANNSNAAS